MRICAVVLVLLQHESLLARNYLGFEFAFGIFSRGQFRIDLFFLLSGFFATWLGGRGQQSQNPGIHFLGDRLRRLLPLIWVLTTAKLMLIVMAGSAGRHEGWGWFQILRSYRMLPAPGYPLILPAWTLSFELIFSTAWSVLLCVSQRVKLATLLLWALAIGLHGFTWHEKPSSWLPGFLQHPIAAHAVLIGLAGGICLIGVGVHLWVERPLLKWFRNSGPVPRTNESQNSR